jgi:hypothetical protein
VRKILCHDRDSLRSNLQASHVYQGLLSPSAEEQQTPQLSPSEIDSSVKSAPQLTEADNHDCPLRNDGNLVRSHDTSLAPNTSFVGDTILVHLDRHLLRGLVAIGRGGIALVALQGDCIPTLYGIFQGETGMIALLLSEARAALNSWHDLSDVQR